MADENPVQGLCEETTCSICLEYFKDPVIIDCGHIFCQACITQCWGQSDGDASCPQCRETIQQRNFKPVRQLASIVEIAKKFSLWMPKEAEALGHFCERHQEPLKLFCRDDQAPICVVCDKSKEHCKHKVIPKDEAFEEYKGKVQTSLQFLKKERGAILSSQQSGETESQSLLEQTETEREKIVAGFKELHQFLEEQENGLLAKLKDLDARINSERNAHTAKLAGEMCSVDLLIREIEEKQKQPASEFLQDISGFLQRCGFANLGKEDCMLRTSLWKDRQGNLGLHQMFQKIPGFFSLVGCEGMEALQVALPVVATTIIRCNKQKFVKPVPFFHGLKEQIKTFSEINPFLDTVIKEFKDTVLAGPQPKKANDDRACAIPTLVLSKDCPTKPQMTYYDPYYGPKKPVYQDPSQLSCWSYVMGVERITSGSFSWETNIKDEKFWAVGVALESVCETSVSSLSPEGGICAVGKSTNNQCYAFISSGRQKIVCPWSTNSMYAENIDRFKSGTIRVSLNYDQGSVTFLNTSNNSTIYTFSKVSFSGQPVSSWVLVGK